MQLLNIAHVTDLTGTVIESSVPLVVFSGNDCNSLKNISACDHLIQQVIPTRELDKTYIVPPNSNRTTQTVTIKKIVFSRHNYIQWICVCD